MSKQTVLLYNPKFRKFVYTQVMCPPLALLAIASPLLKEGYKVKIFDALIDSDAQDKVLKNLNDAICVGFTVFSDFPIADSLKLSKKIKEVDSKIPIVWGGWHPSILPLETIKEPSIDIIARGQGEATFLELVKCLEKKHPLNRIKGITYKKNGRVITNPDRQRTYLDDLPPIPFHILDLEKYVNDTIGKRTLGYITSQGCPYNCAFCADSLVYNRKRIDLSAKKVIRDLKKLIETYKINGIMFWDTNFFINMDKVKKICRGIIKNKWDIKWGAFERVDHFISLNEKTIKLIKNSGCRLLVVGVESGSQKILDFLNKGIKVEDTINFSKLCKKYGIRVRYDFMVGLPNETPEDFQKTINLVRDIYKINKHNELSISFYTPYPGTPLCDKVIKEYDFKPPISLIEWSEYDPSATATKWINEKYKEKLNMFLFYLQFAFLNEYFKKKINERVMFKLLAWPMHELALLRFRLNFFYFPIEREVYLLFKKFLTKPIRQFTEMNV